jgi:hypothetical protein
MTYLGCSMGIENVLISLRILLSVMTQNLYVVSYVSLIAYHLWIDLVEPALEWTKQCIGQVVWTRQCFCWARYLVCIYQHNHIVIAPL